MEISISHCDIHLVLQRPWAVALGAVKFFSPWAWVHTTFTAEGDNLYVRLKYQAYDTARCVNSRQCLLEIRDTPLWKMELSQIGCCASAANKMTCLYA